MLRNLQAAEVISM